MTRKRIIVAGLGDVGILSAIVLVQLSFQGLYELAMWNVDVARRERVLHVLPWIASMVIAVKVVVAGVSLRALHRRGEVTTGTVRQLLSAWVLLVGGMVGLLVWLVPSGQEVTRTLIVRLMSIADGVGVSQPFRVRVLA